MSQLSILWNKWPQNLGLKTPTIYYIIIFLRILKSGQGSARWLFCSAWGLLGPCAQDGFFSWGGRYSWCCWATVFVWDLVWASSQDGRLRLCECFHNGWVFSRERWETPAIWKARPRTNVVFSSAAFCQPEEVIRPARIRAAGRTHQSLWWSECTSREEKKWRQLSLETTLHKENTPFGKRKGEYFLIFF